MRQPLNAPPSSRERLPLHQACFRRKGTICGRISTGCTMFTDASSEEDLGGLDDGAAVYL